MIITPADYDQLKKLQRVQLATSLPGAKPICLVGTISDDGATNLAPFSSITHLGSIPPLIGMVTRPVTVDRHTLSNILATRSWTLNHVTTPIVERAHQCSAKYARDESEFDKCGLTPHFHDGIRAPFVAESVVRYALELEDIIDITANDTKLIVGRVTLIDIPDDCLKDDGGIDLVAAGTLASTALDTYFPLGEDIQLPYARQ